MESFWNYTSILVEEKVAWCSAFRVKFQFMSFVVGVETKWESSQFTFQRLRNSLIPGQEENKIYAPPQMQLLRQ